MRVSFLRRLVIIPLELLLSVSGYTQVIPLKTQVRDHKFFDKTNIILFTTAGVGRGLDCYSTWRFRNMGFQEAVLTNNFVDNKPLFAAYSAGAVGANIGVSYILHRLHQHKLERAVTMIHIGYSFRYDALNLTRYNHNK